MEAIGIQEIRNIASFPVKVWPWRHEHQRVAEEKGILGQ
jgi:hypothetical protein